MLKYLLFTFALFIHHFSSAQTCIGSSQLEHGPGIFQWMESSGNNLLVCGGVYYGTSISYDGNVITAPAGAYATCYVVMTDTSFNLIRIFNHVSFFQQGGAFNDLRIWGMTIDPDLNVLFTGSYTDSILVYGNDTVVSDDYQEGFVAKSDSLGNPLMFKSFGSRHNFANYKYEDRGHCVTTDNSGNIYVGASFDGDYLLVNSDTVHNAVSVGLNGYKQAAVISLTPTGQTRWLKAFGATTHDDSPFGIAVNDSGYVTVCGSTEASNQNFQFGNIVYHYKSSPSGFQAYSGQFDSLGNARWLYPIETYVGTGPDVSAYDVVLDNMGNSYVSGFFDGYAIFNGDTIKTLNYTSAYLLKLSSTGRKVFLKTGNIETFYPYPCALKLKDDKVFVTGQSFTNRLNFEPYGLCCSRDVYFAMYDTTGTIQYLKGLSGAGGVNVAGYDVAFTSSGIGLACGGFSGGTITIEPNTVTTSGTEYYLVRFGDLPSNGLTMSLVNNGSDTIACGGISQLQMTATPPANTRYFWSADNDTIPGPFYGATLNATPKFNSIYYAVAYNGACTVIDSIRVYVDPILVNAGSDTSACTGTDIQLNGDTIPNAKYVWTPSTSLNTDTISNPILTVTGNSQLVYQVTTIQGCINRDTISITAMNVPTVSFTASANNLQLSFSNNSLEADSFLWDFGDGLTDTASYPVHVYSASGNYNICLVGYNECGSDTLCQLYQITNVGLKEIQVSIIIIDKSSEVIIRNISGNNSALNIFDMTGRVVKSIALNDPETILSKSGLTSGIYILKVSDKSGTVINRIAF